MFKCQEKCLSVCVCVPKQGPRWPTSQHQQHNHPLLAINNLGGTAGDVVTALDNEGEQ